MTLRGIGSPTLLVPLTLATVAAACGGKATPPPPLPPQPVVEKKPPPPPPVCVPATEPALVSMASGEAGAAQFCVGDGAEQSACFAVDLERKTYAKLDASPIPQPAPLSQPSARLVASPTAVKVCSGEDDASCKTLAPRVGKGATAPIDAAIDAGGTLAVLMLGNAEAGRGVAEVWDVARGKKTATIKYAKGDHRCGTAQVLGEVIYVSASVCAGPAAKGALYSRKGKKLADVGGKDFGTYGSTAVQLTETEWAFLEESAAVVAVQDVRTGKVTRTIDLLPLWNSGGAEGRGGGNPGESALVRGGDGKLLVIAGSPAAGTVGVVDVAAGEISVIPALPCPADDAAAAPAAAAP